MKPVVPAKEEHSAAGGAPAAEAKKSYNNEESASTSNSVSGETVIKQIAPASQKSAAAKAASASAGCAEISDQQLNYQPIFKQPGHFIKFIEPVFEDYENFSFEELNYEVSNKDLRFLQHFKVDISVPDFERVIDTFEKLVVSEQNQSMVYLVSRFYEKVSKDVASRIPKAILETIYSKVTLSLHIINPNHLSPCVVLED